MTDESDSDDGPQSSYEKQLCQDMKDSRNVTVMLDRLGAEANWLWNALAKSKKLKLSIGESLFTEHAAGLRSLFERENTIREIEVEGEEDGSYEQMEGVIKGLQTTVTLRSLTLYHVPLTQHAAVQLQNIIAYHSTLTDLALRGTTLASNFSFYISKGLEISKTLMRLRIEEGRLTTYDFAVLFGSLARNKTICDLTVDSCEPTDQTRDLTLWEQNTIESGLAENSSLCQLSLHGNQLGRTDILRSILRGLAHNSSVRYVDLSNNSIASEDTQFLVEFLKTRTAPMRMIDLSWNSFSGAKMKDFAQALAFFHVRHVRLWGTILDGNDLALVLSALGTQPSKMRTLDLAGPLGRPGLTLWAFGAIAESLGAVSSIQRLNLCSCGLGESDLLEALLRGLSSNSSIVDLDLSCNGLTDKDAEKIAEMLLLNTSLEKLNLSSNRIGNRGLSAIIAALRNHPLRELSLESNLITSAREIAELLAADDFLEKLHLSGNSIGDDGVKHLVPALDENRSLKVLHLCSCGITDEGASIFGGFLSRKRSLLHLDLAMNSFTEVGVKALVDGMRWNSTVTTFQGMSPAVFPAQAKIVEFYCQMNRIGRKHFIGTPVRDDLWSRVLEKVDSEGRAPCLFHTLCENPDMLARRKERKEAARR